MAEIHHQENELRQELSEKNRMLEQRVKELLALNALFLKYLDMRLKTKKAFNHLVEGHNKLLNEAKILKDSILPN